jgi:hypothetical protein
MEVRLWTNSRKGAPNATFVFRISLPDRKRFFSERSPCILIEIDGATANVELTEGFWRECSEIRHPAIKEFVKRRGLAVWPRGKPPVLALQPVSSGTFKLLLKERD